MKNIYKILTALALVPVLPACSDFLDTVPDERMTIDTPEKVSALLVNAYPKVSFAAIVNTRCDNVTDFGSTTTGSQPDMLFDFMGQNFLWMDVITNGNDTFEQFWSGCYSAISTANHALEAIEAMGGAEKLPAQYGEALVTRAFAHFYIASLFCHYYEPETAAIYPGIPYVVAPETKPITQYERNTLEYTYSRIAEDLEEGMKYMTEGSGFKAPAYHFTSRSAIGFATRFYIMKKDYQKAVSYASQLIPVPAQFDPLLDEGGQPILNADGTPQQNVSSDDAAIKYVQGCFHPFATEYMSMASADDVSEAFNSSKRKGNLLITEATSSIAWSQSLYYQRYGMTRRDIERTFLGSNATVDGQWTYPYYGGQSSGGMYYLVPKYSRFYDQDAVDASSFIPYANIPVLRMEEVLINRIEAYIMTDQYDKAIADMNVFASQRITDNGMGANSSYDPAKHCITRDKLLSVYNSALTDTGHFINRYNTITGQDVRLKKALILALLNFREVEFYWEGLRWYDIVRWNIPITHASTSGKSVTIYPDDDRRILQIPESALLSGVELNPRTNVGESF